MDNVLNFWKLLNSRVKVNQKCYLQEYKLLSALFSERKTHYHLPRNNFICNSDVMVGNYIISTIFSFICNQTNVFKYTIYHKHIKNTQKVITIFHNSGTYNTQTNSSTIRNYNSFFFYYIM